MSKENGKKRKRRKSAIAKIRVFLLTFILVILFGALLLGAWFIIGKNDRGYEVTSAVIENEEAEYADTKPEDTKPEDAKPFGGVDDLNIGVADDLNDGGSTGDKRVTSDAAQPVDDETESADNEAQDESGSNKDLSGAYDDEKKSATVLGEGINEENRYMVKTASADEVTLAFAGDVQFDPGFAIYNKYKSSGGVDRCISPGLLNMMRGADVFMVNNECAISDRGAPLPEKEYTFREKPSATQILKDMGVDIAGVANNHAFDYGEEAFLDTMESLKGANLPLAGAGHDINEAARPVILYANDMKIAIITATQIERYSPPQSRGASESQAGMLRTWPDPTPVLNAIRKAKEECDYVILFIHWGTENQVESDWAQNDQLPKFLEAGTDMIIGAHPHILQPVSYVGDVPVIYSMGNFWFNSKTLDSCLMEVKLSGGELKSLKFVPCQQTGSAVRLLEGAEAERLLEYMRSISPSVNIDAEGYITKR